MLIKFLIIPSLRCDDPIMEHGSKVKCVLNGYRNRKSNIKVLFKVCMTS